jgi:hypothetical protein
MWLVFILAYMCPNLLEISIYPSGLKLWIVYSKHFFPVKYLYSYAWSLRKLGIGKGGS